VFIYNELLIFSALVGIYIYVLLNYYTDGTLTSPMWFLQWLPWAVTLPIYHACQYSYPVIYPLC